MGANDNNSKEVFISYCTKNTDDATYLCNMLEGSGVTCWMAPRDIPAGGSWAESIMTGLESCKVVAFLLSEASLASKEVAKEIDIANGFQKEILQVRIQNAQLTGAFRYHLSSKQWVDAYEAGEKSARFHPSHSAILKMLNKNEVAVVLGDKSVNGQAQSLVARLNQEHRSSLDKLNTMFSVRPGNAGIVNVFLPLRVGATGVDLICEFREDHATKTFNKRPERKDLEPLNGPMFRIYADAASDGDPLKDRFGYFVEKLLPEFSWKYRGRVSEFATLIPPTQLATPLFLEGKDFFCFSRFESYILEFSESVISKILDWLCYASEITDAIEMLENRLCDVFPMSEGWRIGAAEGSRLSGLCSGGKINIYKESWAPQWNNYHDRGQLCFSLESESNFIQGLKIGILKYDTWIDLGEFGQSIFDEGSKLNLAGNAKSAGYAFEYKLAEEWRDSGFAQAKFNWREKYELFVDYIVAEFTKLKPLEALIDKACVSVPALQDKDPAVFPEPDLLRWDASPLYVRNRLRLMAENIKTRCQDTGIDVQYRYRYKKANQDAEWMYSKLLLMVQVENFDVAIEFRFNAHELYAQIVSLYPPDFESVVAWDFIKNRNPGFSFSEISRLNPEKTCHGLSVFGWMDKVQDCIESQVDACISVLAGLPDHLIKCQELSEFCAENMAAVLSADDGWMFENRAKSLEADEPILLYRKSWLVPNQDESVLPPVVVQLLPNKACFDDLSFQIKLMCQPDAELDRAIGMVFGACDFFFGSPETTGIHATGNNDWSKRLDSSVGITGGSDFSKPLIEGDIKGQLADHLRDISSFVKKIEPMLADICRIANG